MTPHPLDCLGRHLYQFTDRLARPLGYSVVSAITCQGGGVDISLHHRTRSCRHTIQLCYDQAGQLILLCADRHHYSSARDGPYPVRAYRHPIDLAHPDSLPQLEQRVTQFLRETP